MSDNNQTVDAAGESDEDAEVGDGLDLAADLVAAVVVLGEFLPGIGLALLHAQADAPALFVDVEHHDLDFLPTCTTLAGLTFLLVQSISETCTRPSTPLDFHEQP